MLVLSAILTDMSHISVEVQYVLRWKYSQIFLILLPQLSIIGASIEYKNGETYNRNACVGVCSVQFEQTLLLLSEILLRERRVER